MSKPLGGITAWCIRELLATRHRDAGNNVGHLFALAEDKVFWVALQPALVGNRVDLEALLSIRSNIKEKGSLGSSVQLVDYALDALGTVSVHEYSSKEWQHTAFLPSPSGESAQTAVDRFALMLRMIDAFASKNVDFLDDPRTMIRVIARELQAWGEGAAPIGSRVFGTNKPLPYMSEKLSANAPRASTEDPFEHYS